MSKYIVVFKPTTTQDQVNEVADEVNGNGGEVTERYDSTILNGFAATIPDAFITTLNSLRGDVIDYIEPDGEITTQ